MRLFHVSEESDISLFYPRLPARRDLDQTIGLVWAIDENRLPNFLTPRNCPRIAYYIGPQTTAQDAAAYFPDRRVRVVVTIEEAWAARHAHATLYLYEFDPKDFVLQDDVAGYYVAQTPQTPVSRRRIDDLPHALRECGAQLRTAESLWPLADEITKTSLNWSLCRMAYAQPRKDAPRPLP